MTYELHHDQINYVVSEQVRHKLARAAAEDDRKLEILDLESGGIVLSVQRKQSRYCKAD